MSQTITPYLMFDKNAEQAVTFYVSLLEDAQVNSIDRWGEDEPGPTGGVKQGRFTLCGREFIAIDSPANHDFGFTPSVSFFIDCENERQLDDLFDKMSAGGKVLMPLDDHGFSKKFAWINDKYGVSWQLNLPADA